MGGLCAVAENAVLVVCALRFKSKVATVIALVGSTAAGLGCMAGPPLGGFLYSLGATDAWKFRIPFIVFSAVPLFFAIFAAFVIPQLREDNKSEGGEGGKEDPLSQQEGGVGATSGVGGGSGEDDDGPLTGATRHIEEGVVVAEGKEDWEARLNNEEKRAEEGGVVGHEACIAQQRQQRQQQQQQQEQAEKEATEGVAKTKKKKGGFRQVLTFQVLITIFALGLNGTVVATLDPTLAYRLKAAPFNFDSGTIGLYVSIAIESFRSGEWRMESVCLFVCLCLCR